MNQSSPVSAAAGLALLLLAGGCATVPGPADPRDPLESYNRAVYKFNDTVDRAVLKPVAKGYDFVTPTFVKTGITNFFSNLDDVRIIANDLLQAKFREALGNTGRLVINTTAGIGGLLDLGTRFGLPKGNEDFGQTLGVWGVQSGPYFVLPLFGPSTIRDSFGRLGDIYVQYPHYVDYVPTRNSVYALDTINTRANLLGTGNILSGAALDEYSFVRDAFLQRRERLIHDGNAVTPKDEFEDEEMEDPAGKAGDGAPKPNPKTPAEQKNNEEKPQAPEKQ
jgi:phospholipid-binding lipoprotein MlaA